jgi:LPS sulfotransferase NodH
MPTDRLTPIDRWDGAPPEDRSRAITVVSGLPRTGTSMMMQMLAAAGIEPYTDYRRRPDQDNPRGYFEHDQAMGLRRDAAWLPLARGKAVKIVAPLLPYLPSGEQYRIVFMHRDLQDVLASQRVMLERLNRAAANVPDAELGRAFTLQLSAVRNWLEQAAGVQVLTFAYEEVVEDAHGAAARLELFLGEPFNRAAAAAAVDARLRHQGHRFH